MVHFIPSVPSGTLFPMSEWPLHITIADVFAINRQATNINTQLATLLQNTTPAKTQAISDGVLGDTPVVLLASTTSLLTLHTAIVDLLEENGGVFNTPHFTKDGFIPHSTIQKDKRLHIGDALIIDSLTLVDMFPDNDWRQRRVIATLR